MNCLNLTIESRLSTCTGSFNCFYETGRNAVGFVNIMNHEIVADATLLPSVSNVK